MLDALGRISEVAARQARKLDLLTMCAAAYADYADIDAVPGVDAFGGPDLEIIAALVLRMTALADLLEHGQLKRGGHDPEIIAQAASAARLMTTKGRTGFQLLYFLGQIERAKREPREW